MASLRSRLQIKARFHSTWSRLKLLDDRYWWAKFILSLIVVAVPVFIFGNNTITDYFALLRRQHVLEREIAEIKPRLRADSLRLSSLKNMGQEIEFIARERYLMKAPGEDIYIIKEDELPKH